MGALEVCLAFRNAPPRPPGLSLFPTGSTSISSRFDLASMASGVCVGTHHLERVYVEKGFLEVGPGKGYTRKSELLWRVDQVESHPTPLQWARKRPGASTVEVEGTSLGRCEKAANLLLHWPLRWSLEPPPRLS